MGDPDVCRAGHLWLSAARQNHLYGKVYLLQNWLDGMFEDCGLDLTVQEAETLMNEATALATTPQAKDDVAQLQENWDHHVKN